MCQNKNIGLKLLVSIGGILYGECVIFIPYLFQMTARALPYLEEDERLLPKLTNLRFVLQDNIVKLSLKQWQQQLCSVLN